MKSFSKILVIGIVIMMLFCSCGKKSSISSDDTLPDETKRQEAITTDAANTTKTDNETTAVETTYEVPDDGKIHVESISLDKYEVNIRVGESDMPWVTMMPDDAEDKGEKWESSNLTVAKVSKYGNITGVGAGECTVTVTSVDNPNVSATVKVKVSASDAEITYIDGVLIANKTYALPSTYNPGVDPEAKAALDEMIKEAKKDGVILTQISGFRSYTTQKSLYNNYVTRDGKAAADRYSARPGHSEHQTGLAFDLNSLDQDFAETKEGKWLAENCWRYGFIIRYPKDKENVTGYMYEPWHVRFLGKDLAKKVYDSGLCLEEYLGITSVYAS